MAGEKYDYRLSALLLFDIHNEFICEGVGDIDTAAAFIEKTFESDLPPQLFNDNVRRQKAAAVGNGKSKATIV